jgi:hypothetical protein
VDIICFGVTDESFCSGQPKQLCMPAEGKDIPRVCCEL